MEILNTDIKTVTFERIEEFCKFGYPEGSELDYKREINENFWKNLQKYVASFANMRGGLIIIGVEEDKVTGKPKNWTGISASAIEIDRIDTIIANMNPSPTVYTHLVSNKDNSLSFILIRIFDGNNSPFYRQNDPIEWIRTGKVSKPIEPASPNYKRLLFERNNFAYGLRYDILKEADQTHVGLSCLNPSKKVTQTAICSISILPYSPDKVLIKPFELSQQLPSLIINLENNEEFPPNHFKFKTSQNGIYTFNRFYNDKEMLIQLFSKGLVNVTADLYDEGELNGVVIERIPKYLHRTLLLAKKFYKENGYQGELNIEICFQSKEIGLDLYRYYRDDLGETMKLIKTYQSSSYTTSTRELNTQLEYNKLLTTIYKDMFVNFGFEPFNEDVIRKRLKLEQ